MKVLLHVCMSRYYLATHFLNENDSEVHWSVYFQAKNVFVQKGWVITLK